MKKNLLKNSHGFSLAEVMVAAGLLGVISLGVMQLMSNMTRGQKEFEQNAEMRGIIDRIAVGLQDSNTCNYSLVALKYGNDGSLFTTANIAASSKTVFDASVEVAKIAKPKDLYFLDGNMGPQTSGNIEEADDNSIATSCDENYAGDTTSAGLRASGCLYGQDKGRLLIHKMWLGQDGGGNTKLFIRFIMGGLINYYQANPGDDLPAYYAALKIAEPAKAAKLSGSFGTPIIVQEVNIQYSDVADAAQLLTYTNLGMVAEISDPIGGLAVGDLVNCFTNLTDTIQAACENFGGTYMNIDGSCRALKIRNNTAQNAAEAGYGQFIPTIPTGGAAATAIATEGHFYVGPMDNIAASEAVGSNAWISGKIIAANPNTAVAHINANQGDILVEGTVRVGDKGTTAIVSTPLDTGSIFAQSGLQLGGSLAVPAANSGDIHSTGGVALGGDNGADPGNGTIMTSGGISLGTTANVNPGAGNIKASGGIALGTQNVVAPDVGDIHSSGGIAIGGQGGTNPDDGDIYTSGTYYGDAHVRLLGSLSVGTGHDSTNNGEAQITGMAFSHGLSLAATNAKALTTIEWVANRIAKTLAPEGSDTATIAADILSAAIEMNPDSAAHAILRDACIRTTFRNQLDAKVYGAWNKTAHSCEIVGNIAMPKDCSIGYQCQQVYSNTFVHAKSYVRAITYLRSGTYAQIGTSLSVGTSASIGTTMSVGQYIYVGENGSGRSIHTAGNIYAADYMYSGTYVRAISYVRGSKFCIGGTANSSCITRVKSGNCGSTQKVVGWKNGQVICINEARHY